MFANKLRILTIIAMPLLLWQCSSENTDKTQTDNVEQPTGQNRQQTAQSLHQACRYADSLGIDTTRYAAGSADDAARLRRLLTEIRYGKKPSRQAFSGLKETLDTAWTAQTAAAFSIEALDAVNQFTPYRQLVGHYNRLRKQAANPALTDSLRLVRQSLNFYRYVNRFPAEQFVIVNIPAGELNVFDATGKRLLPMQVIAGRDDRQTPCMTTRMTDIVAYPYWNVPKNIVVNEMLPKLKRDVAYLYNENLQVLDEKGNELDPESIDWESLSAENFPYRLRQASGCENALGLIKFNLENPLAIYLLDTNSRDLFTQTSDRWRSHGCVRVQKPVQLANLVLRDSVFSADFMNKCLIDQKPRTMPLPKQVPVFITYNVADVDAAGRLRFYKDVYGFDKNSDRLR